MLDAEEINFVQTHSLTHIRNLVSLKVSALQMQSVLRALAAGDWDSLGQIEQGADPIVSL